MKLPRFIRLASEATSILAGQIVNILGSLALIRLLTEHITVAVYGQWALCLSIVAIVNQVVMGGIIAALARYHSIAIEGTDIRGYLNGALLVVKRATLGICVTAAVGVIALALMGQTSWIPLLLTLGALALLGGYNSCLAAIRSAARSHLIVAIHNGAGPWLTVVLILTFGGRGEVSLLMIAVPYAISALLIFSSQLMLFKNIIPKNNKGLVAKPSHDWPRVIIKFALPFSLFGAFSWAQQISDRWALEYFSSTDTVGQYAVLFQLGFAPGVLGIGLLMQFLAPILYKISGAANDPDRNRKVKRMALGMVAISLLGTIILFLITLILHTSIFMLLTASHYWAMSYYLPWMVLAGGLFGAGELLALKAMVEIQLALITKIKIITALSGVSFNILGACLFGLKGVVFALLLFCLLYFTLMLIAALNQKSLPS